VPRGAVGTVGETHQEGRRLFVHPGTARTAARKVRRLATSLRCQANDVSDFTLKTSGEQATQCGEEGEIGRFQGWSLGLATEHGHFVARRH
jgi:hypothetical protein